MKINTMGAFVMGCVATVMVMGLAVSAMWPAPAPVSKYTDLLPSTNPELPFHLIIHGVRWNMFIGNDNPELAPYLFSVKH